MKSKVSWWIGFFYLRKMRNNNNNNKSNKVNEKKEGNEDVPKPILNFNITYIHERIEGSRGK